MPCTAEQLVGDSRIPIRHSVMRHVTEILYDTPINENSDIAHTSTLIAKAIASYTNNDEIDEDLLKTYQDEFEGWTINQFSIAEPEARKGLKQALRSCGIYLAFALLSAQVLPEWDEDELLKQPNLDPRSKFFEYRQRLILNRQRASQQIQSEPPLSPQSHLKQHPPLQYERTPSIKNQNSASQLIITEDPYPQKPQYQRLNENLASKDATKPQEHFDIYSSLPTEGRIYGHEVLDLQTQTAFTKIFNNDDRYTGNLYDLLDVKVLLFLNICQAAGIKPSHFHTVFPRILTGKARNFQLYHISNSDDFGQQYLKIKRHFEHDIHRGKYYTDWTTTRFENLRAENREKSLQNILELLIDKLQLCQRALGPQYMGDEQLRTAIINACRGVPELEYAMMSPSKNCEQLFDQLRSSVEVNTSRTSHAMVFDSPDNDSGDYVDRRYNSNARNRGMLRDKYNISERSGNSRHNHRTQGEFRHNSKGRSLLREQGQRFNGDRGVVKRCFVCSKEGCWSINHSIEERKRAKQQYMIDGNIEDDSQFAQYLADFEGNELDGYIGEEGDDDIDNVHDVMHKASIFLNNAAFIHRLTGENIYCEQNDPTPAHLFTIEDRYTSQVWQGIMPDSGASNYSTGGKAQYIAFKREDPSVMLNTSNAREANIQFGPGEMTSSIGTVELVTAIGNITFHILETPTPFLLCLKDMDNLNVCFNNITNQLIQGTKEIPVVRKWGHAWFHLRRVENVTFFLTETELRRLHRRFGHPAANRLYNLLTKAGHDDVDLSTLQNIENFCHHCQIHSSALKRFKLTLKDDHEFNYEVFVDVLYINGKPVLHVVDSATSFHGAKFLKSLSTRDTFEIFRIIWADTYLGPPDKLTHDVGTNFSSVEWRNDEKLLGIICKQIPTEAHWSIGKVERAHISLRKAWDILYAELSSFTTEEAILQMAVKSLNDTMGPDGLVPTLLVFGAYPRITNDSPPSQSTLKRGEAVSKAMAALRKITATRQVNEALNTRNGPDDSIVLALPLQSEVLVWRENKGWKGPFKIVAIQGHNITVDMVNGPVTFRSTHVRPYNRYDRLLSDSIENAKTTNSIQRSPSPPIIRHDHVRHHGRPKGSKNKASKVLFSISSPIYLSKKEENDRLLSLKLRDESIIKGPGLPFEESDAREIDQLCERGVFQFVLYDPQGVHKNIRLFKSRMVREIKGKTDKPYEKSRLVIAGHSDVDKTSILTQSPTIQRVSQRLLIAIAASLIGSSSLELRDITQAYPQSRSVLQRQIIAQLPPEIQH